MRRIQLTDVQVQISDFHHEVAENCALLDYYAASSGNYLQTFRDNLSVQSSVIKNLLVPTFDVKNPKKESCLFILDP
jgi:hypothetical protein